MYTIHTTIIIYICLIQTVYVYIDHIRIFIKTHNYNYLYIDHIRMLDPTIRTRMCN